MERNIELIDPCNFERKIGNQQVKLFTLKNKDGLVTQITNYGGRVVSLWTPDKNGDFEDIVLGYDSLDGYLQSNEKFFGAIIGRYGNRIANGKFTLNNTNYMLAQNIGTNHLHGGETGYHDIVWNAIQITDSELVLDYLSKDGEEGYPGNLHVKVIYKLTDENELKINYNATTDKDTPVNLTHHSFFNLKGAGQENINDHILQINASYYTPVNEHSIPTGELKEVANTPFDFRIPKRISNMLNEDDTQIKYGSGYDHNFVLEGSGIRTVANIKEPKSGRQMEVLTNEPGMQFYGGNFLNGKDIGKEKLTYNHRSAFCLETQHFPNSPNQPNFPSTIINSKKPYTSTCIYKFTS